MPGFSVEPQSHPGPREAVQLLHGSDSCLSACGTARQDREEVNGSYTSVGWRAVEWGGAAEAFDLITGELHIGSVKLCCWGLGDKGREV